MPPKLLRQHLQLEYYETQSCYNKINISQECVCVCTVLLYVYYMNTDKPQTWYTRLNRITGDMHCVRGNDDSRDGSSVTTHRKPYLRTESA